ncbi:MAG TPA: leucyl aminopeptidase [Oribacterium sp.]|nr:leucyl aminopeptidase [Oribacterium sp.]
MTERYRDIIERIREIPEEKALGAPYEDYFSQVAHFILLLDAFLSARFGRKDAMTAAEEGKTGPQASATATFADGQKMQERSPEAHSDNAHPMAQPSPMSPDALEHWNTVLYAEAATQYAQSYLNPAYAEARLGTLGTELSALYMEIEGLILSAYEGAFDDMVCVLETFVQIYCMFVSGIPTTKQLRDVLYSYAYDYSEDFLRRKLDAMYLPERSYARRVLLDHDFRDAKDIYAFGYYVSDTALQTAAFLAKLPDDRIDRMAFTWYKGFKDGFQIQGKPYEKKSVIEFCYPAGFERVVKRTAQYFAEDGYDFTLPFRAQHFLTRTPGKGRQLYESPNPQMDYDHSYDLALVMGDRIAARMLEEQQQIFRSYGKEIGRYAGPVVMESFGAPEFEPLEKPARLRFTPHQAGVYGHYQSSVQLLVHQFVLEEERSFTIIAWPLPTIGPDFEAIFQETEAVNTLSSEAYRPIQERLIDALDQAGAVHVVGKGNATDLRVMLHPLQDSSRESNFENCLSDVNIPLGEVFTSPQLEGTEGVLHVHSVFIEGFQFKELRLVFENGRVTDYGCANFPDPEQGRALIRKVIFGEKEGLPMGEFAIGTNTRAYRMAQRYGIGALLPILIAEKTGPHFAVGDTCYSFMEEMHLYNPDGKELVAKDNSCSILRKTAPEKAYFAVHTDITIPYHELDTITALRADGSAIPLIADGRFVLPGTEVLNEPLDA